MLNDPHIIQPLHLSGGREIECRCGRGELYVNISWTESCEGRLDAFITSIERGERMSLPTFTNTAVFRYRVKVIHPKCKKNYKWLNLNDVSRKFTTVLELKQQLISSLGEHVPAHSEISTFNVGYLKKPAQSKQWLITE